MFTRIMLTLALIGAIGVVGLSMTNKAQAQTWQWQGRPYTTYYAPSPYYYSPYTTYYGGYPTYYGGNYYRYQAPVYQPYYSYYPGYYSGYYSTPRVVTVPF